MADGAKTEAAVASAPRREVLAGVPEGLAPLVLAQLLDEQGGPAPIAIHVARDDRRMEAITEGLKFFAPRVKVVPLPAWDTVPYDRIGPNPEIVAQRVETMARLVAQTRKQPTLVLTTANAILQRLPPREFIRKSLKVLAAGQRMDRGRQGP